MQYYGYEKEAGFQKYIELALENGISLEGLIKGSNEEFPVAYYGLRTYSKAGAYKLIQYPSEMLLMLALGLAGASMIPSARVRSAFEQSFLAAYRWSGWRSGKQTLDLPPAPRLNPIQQVSSLHRHSPTPAPDPPACRRL